MTSPLRVIVTGLIAQHPTLGGVTWDYVQYAIGLARLGHDVYYFEDSGEWPYNLDGGPNGDDWVARDPTANVQHLAGVLSRYGLGDRWAYHFPLDGRWFGLSNEKRREVLATADLLLNISGTIEHPGAYRCVRRLVYVDSDPVFTQVKLAAEGPGFAERVDGHDVHFSFGEQMSAAVPVTGHRWRPTRQPIVLSEWRPGRATRPVYTTVMNWTSYPPLTHDGVVYGQKDVEFKHFVELPARVAPVKLEVALSCLGAQLAISVNNCPPPRDPRSRMTSFKRTQRKYVQKAYRVRNWREYETGLRARGSLTVWLGLTDGKLANWNSPRSTRRKPGRQRKYSNHAIETTVTLGLVFGLASRQTEGFLRSLLTLLNLDNDVPDHSTISRRKARLGKVASYERRTVKPVHLLIDSSGLSVHVGQLRTPPKARDYRKLHLAVDEHTSDVVACELTSKRARDASRVASLVGQIERPIASAKADAAYDTGDVYKTLENHRAHRSPKVLIPPRTGAQLALDSAGTRQRNRNIRARSRVGKRKWYVASGYSRRSKVETTFHRYKAILGSAMRARGLASQRVEVRLGCKILNTMTALGIPDGEMIG